MGWNITWPTIFSKTIIENQLLIVVKPVPGVTLSYPLFFGLLLLLMASVLVANYLLLKRRKQSELLLQNQL